MKARIHVLIATLSLVTCTDRGHIPGTYVRIYSFSVTDLQTGAVIGTRTIRDTIFLTTSSRGYQLSNRRWMHNDYDTAGWRNMEHADDRPLPECLLSFSPADSLLISGLPFMPTLSLKKIDRILYLCHDERREHLYRKIN